MRHTAEDALEPILIWGAGAIGATIGASLVRAGHRIHFTDIVPEHVAAINAGQLRIEGPLENFTVGAPAWLAPQLQGRYRCIFLCTKAQDTEPACRALATHLAADGCVVSLQNGLNESLIGRHVTVPRTVGAFINFGADYLGPGRILYGGRGAVVVGELDGRASPRLEALHRILKDFDPAAITTDNIDGYLWGKMGYGALLFATALTDSSIAEVLEATAYRPVLAALAREITAVAVAKRIRALGFNGYRPEAFAPGAAAQSMEVSFIAMAAHNRKSVKTHSGIWRDLAVRKRKTEVDAQLGLAADAGEALNLQMPLTRCLISLIHDIEAGRRPLSWDNLDRLKDCHAD